MFRALPQGFAFKSLPPNSRSAVQPAGQSSSSPMGQWSEPGTASSIQEFFTVPFNSSDTKK
jgi:hypothetical protein